MQWAKIILNLKGRKTKEQNESSPQPSFHKQEIIMMHHLSKEGYNSNINDKYSSYFVMTIHQRIILDRMKYDHQYSDRHGKN